MIYVIGSGPAAIAAAVGLVNKGVHVTILDAGKTLEPEKQEILDRVALQERAQWSPADIDALRGEDQSSREGSIHVKRTYGSEYPYEDHGVALHEPGQAADFHYSMACGGLSQVWGSSLMPARAQDIQGWPVTAAELAPHFRAVLDFMPSTAVKDDLEAVLPAFTERGECWEPSQQAAAFFADWKRHRDPLARSGIHFGRSRMAVKAGGDARRHACNYCGLCLYGCPYSLIYSSAHTLEDLVQSGKVTYIKDHVVEKLESVPGGVKIHALDVRGNTPVAFHARRVYLGAGILPTAAIVLNSLGAYNTPLRMLDSQYFIYPFFRFRKTAGVQTESLHSLAQAFLEIDDPAVSKGLVHIEVFTFSDFLKRALLDTPIGFLLRFGWIADQLFGRLLVLQGFIHSDESSRIRFELQKRDGQRPTLAVRPESRWRSFWTSLKVGLKLFANSWNLGGVTIFPAIQFAKPGRSYHSGGGFPMRENPGRFETDRLGRLSGLEGVHLVDGSVLPSIPATTMTLGVMANAHRIAVESLELEKS